MKRVAISRSDPEVIREWQRRGVEAAQAKARKLSVDGLRRQEREAARDGSAIRVFPEALTPVRAKKKNRPSGWDRTKARIRERSGGACEAQGPACTGRAIHVHHVLPRGRGGKDNGSTPLLDVCRECHEYIHAHPAESYDLGWLIESGP